MTRQFKIIIEKHSDGYVAYPLGLKGIVVGEGDTYEEARLGFRVVREGSHIAMVRENPDGTRTPLTMPNHSRIKGATLRTILTQAGIARDEFLSAYEES